MKEKLSGAETRRKRLACKSFHEALFGRNSVGVRKNIGATGFEPATSWSQTKRSTKLSYAPEPRKLSAFSPMRQEASGKFSSTRFPAFMVEIPFTFPASLHLAQRLSPRWRSTPTANALMRFKMISSTLPEAPPTGCSQSLTPDH